MRKKITSILFAGLFVVGFSGLSYSVSPGNVEALTASTLCGTVAPSIHTNSPVKASCLGSNLTFEFSYDFEVTGFSSGSDGY